MARDLASTPVTGVFVQLCGDAHVANFGVFASPERNLLFDLNDFDETIPGPWEWDLKRLAASAVVAARTAGLRDAQGVEAARAAVRTYRVKMSEYSQMGILEVWYSRVDAEAAMKALGAAARDEAPVRSAISAAHGRTSAAALPRLTAMKDGGGRRIVDHPPLVTHDAITDNSELLGTIVDTYRSSLEDDRCALFERFEVADFALKVVGVGSVGTRCFIALFVNDLGEPLFLQAKEAERSALDGWVPAPTGVAGFDEPRGDNRARGRSEAEGRRVVTGQRLMQAASDIFLGWASADGFDYYIRQLRDMKGSVDLSSISASAFSDYLELCGWTLARAHARTGRATVIGGYLGTSEVFDDAISSFARSYADQTERDHALLVEAVRQGRIQAEKGV